MAFRDITGFRHAFKVVLVCLFLSPLPILATDQPAVDPHSVPSVDAGLGSCSVEFTVRDVAGKPIYAAKVKVRVAYGFMSARKLDMEVGTNVDGKARFDGLSTKLKQPLRFAAFQADLEGSAVYDPAENCKAQHVIVISKAAREPAQP